MLLKGKICKQSKVKIEMLSEKSMRMHINISKYHVVRLEHNLMTSQQHVLQVRT